MKAYSQKSSFTKPILEDWCLTSEECQTKYLGNRGFKKQAWNRGFGDRLKIQLLILELYTVMKPVLILELYAVVKLVLILELYTGMKPVLTLKLYAVMKPVLVLNSTWQNYLTS